MADSGPLITSAPNFRGGRPYIAGTGVMVMRIAGWYRLGMKPEEIAFELDLSLAQVNAALAYYYANRAEIEADLANETAFHDHHARQHN